MTALVAPFDSDLQQAYGPSACLCPCRNETLTLVLSQDRTIDLYELERLLESVGWSRRPLRRVRRALEHSVMVVGLWRHDPRMPRLIGFARCTGDGVIEATIWDVAIHPSYQGAGLGRALMDYVLAELRRREVERVSLFADPGVVDFYARQGWDLEPLQRRCAFWYAT
ncbi:GNAT family N-acetyltransferase [Synechococcus sp. RSCCF101]|uniref:GNAT family N-acetyltransferase n=1 Tax=Synechococcus sp. RSCCF101 TaxID=2511069 RepID=UPI001247D740|nr:GNAT family N-acetyltransferase [Synechococcus sp. RSCCF101]QEY31319.1 GNAT family N-acetyltransferase [Synechococcus sp. RSCCF101]